MQRRRTPYMEHGIGYDQHHDKEMEIAKFRILIEQDEVGVVVAECPSLPGCVSQGKTRKKAIENMQDAIKGYLESLRQHNEPIPHQIEEEVVEVGI